MIFANDKLYSKYPFQLEKDFEAAVIELQKYIFGPKRLYIDVKKKIGAKNGTQNIPDGYLLDLSNSKNPSIIVVENELSAHEPIKHIALQILEFSLSYESSPVEVKSIIRDAISKNPELMRRCNDFINANAYENIDVLLERAIYGKPFSALILIDEVDDELEKVITSKFKFPVEIKTIERYKSEQGDVIYDFVPFLSDGYISEVQSSSSFDEVDTIVVPAQEEGFNEVFINKNCWHAIRLSQYMIPKIKYIAGYQVAPHSAVTYVAEVQTIQPYKDTGKYLVIFKGPARKIEPIKLREGKDGRGGVPQAPRYTSYAKIATAKFVDELW
ncbi:MAG: hypothetical protein KF713_13200 [Turneriella sp.]|nr:hypothetical protein [Turneriella sp.]